MRIDYGSVTLVDQEKLRSQAPYALDCSVSVQVRELIRATSAGVDSRGNRRVVWPLTVPRTFENQRLAEEFFFLHFGTLPDTGTMAFYCGQGANQSRLTATATLQSCRIQNPSATAVLVSYTFVLGPITPA